MVTVQVIISKTYVSPDPAELKAGDTVEWVASPSAFRVHSTRPEFDSGDLEVGKTFSYQYTAKGEYEYLVNFVDGVGPGGGVVIVA